MITSQGISSSMLAGHVGTDQLQLALELVAGAVAVAKEESAAARAQAVETAE